MDKIIWKGYFEGDSGYINACKYYPIALQQQGFDVGVQSFNKVSENNPVFKMQTQDKGFNILHQIPTVSPKEKGYFTVTEFNIAPPSWWQPLDNSDIIMTQSQFCKDIFSKIPGIDPDKIHIVHFPLRDSMTPDGEVLIFEKQYRFLFGSILEWVARKKPELMLEAFLKEFPLKDFPDVGFVLRMDIPQGMGNWKWMLNEITNGDPRIHVIGRVDNIADFYRTLDCYCSPTAGEGWGATLCEAMACGVPTIGSRHSGNLEYMNDSNSYLVEVGEWQYIDQDKTNNLWMVHPFQKWKLPKVESIQKQMRTVYNLKMSGKSSRKAKEGLKVRELLSMKNIGRQLKNAMDTVL